MTLRFQHAALLALPLTLALSVSACSDDTNTGGTDDDETESGSESTGDGDGDETGSDSNTTTTTSESDTDCPVGAEGCPCTNGGSCDAGLMCEDGLCVPATPGDGDGDPATGDGDGDDPSGDGDGDTGGDGDGDTGGDGDGDTGGDACEGDEFIEIDAVDAAEIVGWDPTMSNFGEGLILAWDEVTPDAYVSFDIDVPCDDDWHVWVRAINFQQQDSFFVLVNGEPNPPPIFEVACDGGPNQQPEYLWNELNWRDPDAGACEYVEDPWIQAWAAGPHNVTLGYRESYALVRMWITNTDQMPPDP